MVAYSHKSEDRYFYSDEDNIIIIIIIIVFFFFFCLSWFCVGYVGITLVA